MPGEQAIDFMDNQINSRADLNALLRPSSSSPEERNYAFTIYPGGADLNALSIEP